MVRVLLLIILAYVVARVLWRLLKGVFEGLGYHQPGTSPPSVGLVRDPVCGTFVMPSKALTSGSGSNTRYFCSERCRQAYGHSGNMGHGSHGRSAEETRKS